MNGVQTFLFAPDIVTGSADPDRSKYRLYL